MCLKSWIKHYNLSMVTVFYAFQVKDKYMVNIKNYLNKLVWFDVH